LVRRREVAPRDARYPLPSFWPGGIPSAPSHEARSLPGLTK